MPRHYTCSSWEGHILVILVYVTSSLIAWGGGRRGRVSDRILGIKVGAREEQGNQGECYTTGIIQPSEMVCGGAEEE